MNLLEFQAEDLWSLNGKKNSSKFLQCHDLTGVNVETKKVSNT